MRPWYKGIAWPEFWLGYAWGAVSVLMTYIAIMQYV